MIKLTTAAIFFLLAGIFTSTTLIGAYQIFFTLPALYFSYMAIKEKNINLPKSAWFLLAFTFVALVSNILNFDVLENPSSSFGRLKYSLYGIGGIFVLRSWLNETSDKTKKILIHLFFLSIVIAAIAALWSLTHGGRDGRARGFTPIMRYGYGTAMMLAALLGALLHRKLTNKWFDWRIGSIVFAFAFAGMYFTYTRGALLGLICSLPFAVYFYNKRVAIIAGSLAFLSASILAGFYLFGSQNYESRFLMNKNNESDKIRMGLWTASVIALNEKPVLGWGYANFSTQVERIKTQHDLFWPDYVSHSHNLFLEVAAGTGLIGLLLFLGWVFSWAIEITRTEGLTRAITLPFGVVFVISSQFEMTFDTNNAAMIFFAYSLSSVFTSKVVTR